MPNFNHPDGKPTILKVAAYKLQLAADRATKLAQLAFLNGKEPGTKLAASELEKVAESNLPAACLAAELMNKISSKEVTLQDAAAFERSVNS